MDYRREIDGLRALAVLPVIAFHANSNLIKGGFLGVDIFFAISGYLITSIILAEKSGGSFTILNFYERRARRILPALFFVILVCLPFAWFLMLPAQLKEFSQSLIAVVLFASNIFFWSENSYFGQTAELKPMLHTWSLAVEEQFYVFFPLALSFLWYLGRNRLFAAILVVALASLIVSQYGAVYHKDANFFLTPTRAWELLAGSLCAFVVARRDTEVENNILANIGLALILASMLLIDQYMRLPGFLTLFPIAGVAFIVLYASPKTYAGRILGTPALVGVGLISYSAYLWHQPIFAFARIFSLEPIKNSTYFLLAILSLFLAYLTWRFVEQPFRKKRDGTVGFSKNAIFSCSGITSAALVIAALAVSLNVVSPAHYRDLVPTQVLLEDLETSRSAFTERGRCEVWPPNGRWRQDWQNCNPFATTFSVTNERQPFPVLIVGDSHATDLAVGLRKNGMEPMQGTGLGCSLHPKGMDRHCRGFFDLVKEELETPNAQSIKQIWMTNRFSTREFREMALRETFEYWSTTDRQLVLFTGKPEYQDRNNRILKAEMWGVDYSQTADRSISSLATLSYVADLANEFGVIIVNSDQVFCSLSADCSYLTSDGEYLTLDYGHLSVLGADQFLKQAAKTFLCSPEQRLILPQLVDETPCSLK